MTDEARGQVDSQRGPRAQLLTEPAEAGRTSTGLGAAAEDLEQGLRPRRGCRAWLGAENQLQNLSALGPGRRTAWSRSLG